jgi:hypothetical protein
MFAMHRQHRGRPGGTWPAPRRGYGELDVKAVTGVHPASRTLADPGGHRLQRSSGPDGVGSELVGWLAEHRHLAERRALLSEQPRLLSNSLARQDDMNVVRLAADLGDEDAFRWLERWAPLLQSRHE